MGNRSCFTAGAFALALAFTSADAASPGANQVIDYEEAVAAGEYDRAAARAAGGCIDARDFASCRRLAALPIHMGNTGAAVPHALAERLRQAASAVCRSREPMKDILGRDITARECAHLAGRFVLARDPEYATALAPESARFFASIYEPARTRELTRASATRTRSAAVE